MLMPPTLILPWFHWLAIIVSVSARRMPLPEPDPRRFFAALKPCPRCGQPAELVKTGSRRFWVQCSRYPAKGTCSTIAARRIIKRGYS